MNSIIQNFTQKGLPFWRMDGSWTDRKESFFRKWQHTNIHKANEDLNLCIANFSTYEKHFWFSKRVGFFCFALSYLSFIYLSIYLAINLSTSPSSIYTYVDRMALKHLSFSFHCKASDEFKTKITCIQGIHHGWNAGFLWRRDIAVLTDKNLEARTVFFLVCSA